MNTKLQIILAAVIIAVTPLANLASQPNFLIIIADDMNWHDVGAFGGTNVPTKHLDQMAADGIKFTQMFTPSPMCSPTRHAMYNGMFPVRSGAHPNHAVALPGTRSIPHYLEPLGYRVGLLGKTHIEPEENYPFEYLETPEHTGRGHPDLHLPTMKEFIERDADQPWCLVLASNEPHAPWIKGNPRAIDLDEIELPPYLFDTPETRELVRSYLAEIVHLDNQIGDALKVLEQAGMAENTLVMFFSEQGAALPHCKFTLYDTGIRAATIMRWPAAIEPGTVTDALSQYVDVLPTMIEAAGGTPPADICGLSFKHLFTNPDASHRDHVFGIQTSRGIRQGPQAFGIRAVRDDRYKLIWNTHPENRFQSAVNTRQFFQTWIDAANRGDPEARARVNAYFHRPKWEFYDVEADPFEMNNLYGNPAHAERINEMKSVLHAWMRSQGDLGRETEITAIDRMRRGAQRRALRALDSD